MSDVSEDPFSPGPDGSVDVALPEETRDVLRGLAASFRMLLTERTPSSDPSLQRLFPPAYPDEPLRNLDYERLVAGDLLSDRLGAIDLLERTAGSSRLSSDEAMAWMRVFNDMRLVFGTRLDVTEETDAEDFSDAEGRQTFELYMHLGWFVSALVDALGSPETLR
jgi:hypothetical protein